MDTINANKEGQKWFEQHKVKPFAVNRRVAVRYKRNDIYVSLKKAGYLNMAFAAKQASMVKLLDISSKGIAIATNMKLTVNSKIMLTIIFNGTDSFEIPGKVMRYVEGKQTFGIKFDKVNDLMADCLVNTKHITFK